MFEITSVNRPHNYPQNKKSVHQKQEHKHSECKNEECFYMWQEANGTYNCIKIKKQILKNDNKLNIPNFQALPNNGARGESLSSKKNRHNLRELKNIGIDTIIDLRDKYSSGIYPQLCKENNLNYYNIPIDSFEISDKRIIENLPLLFDLINKGGFYIACAQGLHRTDIALSINYIYNPKAKEIPILYGHFREDELKFDDIARRLHSIKKTISPKELRNIGWEADAFHEEFKYRKQNLKDFNTTYFNQ